MTIDIFRLKAVGDQWETDFTNPVGTVTLSESGAHINCINPLFEETLERIWGCDAVRYEGGPGAGVILAKGSPAWMEHLLGEVLFAHALGARVAIS